MTHFDLPKIVRLSSSREFPKKMFSTNSTSCKYIKSAGGICVEESGVMR